MPVLTMRMMNLRNAGVFMATGYSSRRTAARGFGIKMRVFGSANVGVYSRYWIKFTRFCA
jgi:hypothetical protein